MLNKDQVCEVLRRHSDYLANNYGAKSIALFGSFARDVSDDDSDVDLLVEFEPPIGLRFIEFTEYLEGLLGRKVDVLTPDGLRSIRVERVARNIEESLIHVTPDGR